MDAKVEPTGMYLRRLPAQATHKGVTGYERKTINEKTSMKNHKCETMEQG